jgi:replicative DNA helicase
LLTSEKKTTREQEVGDMAQRVKNLARALGIPVILLAQLNRAIENRPDTRPVKSDLRDSGQIEAHSDLIIAPWLKETKGQSIGSNPVEGEIIILKQRKGPEGTVPIVWNPKFQTFSMQDKHREEADQDTPPQSNFYWQDGYDESH